MNNHFLSIKEASVEDLRGLLRMAGELKRAAKSGTVRPVLAGKTLVMLFEGSSTRTRLSFEVAMGQLGGQAIYFDQVSSQISRGETLADTGRTLSAYADVALARVSRHSDLLELARAMSIPLINGMTDKEHPCQALGDMFTLEEIGKLDRGRKLVFLGDCQSPVASSVTLAAAKLGLDVTLACPPLLAPGKELLRDAGAHAQVEVVHDAEKAVAGADVLYTYLWSKKSAEEEDPEKMRVLLPFQLNARLLEKAKKDAVVMHALPARRGMEITGEVLDGPQSIVWPQAENRLHAQKALLYSLLKK